MPESELRDRIADLPAPPPLTPSAEGFDVIAEVKRRAPGAGAVSRRPTVPDDPELPARLTAAYVRGGAVAVSVLTEPLAFGGSLTDLAMVARTLADGSRPIPAMRKDFVVDPYQVLEARAAGAGGVLLIADLLEDAAESRASRAVDVSAILDAVAEAELWVLVEAFSETRLGMAVELVERAAALGLTTLLGVNVRDLRTLDLDDGRLARAARRLPPELPAVAESGMRSPDDVATAARLGYRFALVGRALSRAVDAETLLAEMIRAGRGARRQVVAP